jgi:hypothetical protein
MNLLNLLKLKSRIFASLQHIRENKVLLNNANYLGKRILRGLSYDWRIYGSDFNFVVASYSNRPYSRWFITTPA